MRYRRVMPYVLAVYLAGVATAFLFFNVRLTLELVAAILLVAAFLTGRARLFLRDWGAFLVVLVGWQLASPLATTFHFRWHLTELIGADKLLFFGTVPSVWLQQHLYHPGTLEPWDVLAATIYMLHFLTPLVAGFVLWLVNRDLFQRFALAFVLVALAGFVTYVLYPAVPPWLAAWRLAAVHGTYQPSVHGQVYLPGVHNLFNVIAGHWYNPYHGNISLRFLHMHYDNVGAMPSEHAAYPLLFFLFLRRQFGRIAYLSLIYIGLLVFSIVYLGQHYVIDAIVGFGYAATGYVIVMHLAPGARRLPWRRVAALAVLRVGRAELEEA